MSATPTGDRILDVALTEGRRGVRRHLAWQVFACTGMLTLAVALGALLLVPAVHLVTAPIVSAAVEYDAPGGRVHVVINLDDGRQARGAVGGDVTQGTVPVRFDPARPEHMARPQGLWLQLAFALVITGAFGAATAISARSIQHHVRALRRMRDELDPATRERRRMLASSTYHRSRYGGWGTLLLTEPGEPGPWLKTRFFSRHLGDVEELEVTLHGRIGHRGYAVIETDDGELIALHEPLLRTLSGTPPARLAQAPG